LVKIITRHGLNQNWVFFKGLVSIYQGGKTGPGCNTLTVLPPWINGY